MKSIPQLEAEIQNLSEIIEKQGQAILRVGDDIEELRNQLDVQRQPMPATAANTISRSQYETATAAGGRSR